MDSKAANQPDLVSIRVGERRQSHAFVGFDNLAWPKTTLFQLAYVGVQVVYS
jgi:hypothetical protein